MRTFKEFKEKLRYSIKKLIPGAYVYITKDAVYVNYIKIGKLPYDIENLINGLPYMGITPFDEMIAILSDLVYYKFYNKFPGPDITAKQTKNE